MTKPQPKPEPPHEDEVLRRMLATPPAPKKAQPKNPKKPKKPKKPAK